MDLEAVPTRFACSLLNLAAERGYEHHSILNIAGIAFNPLNKRSPGYQTTISAMQYSKLYQQVVSLVQDEAFGLMLGKNLTPGAFRMMCYCLISCENLGNAIKRACEFFRTFYDADAQIYLDTRKDSAIVGYGSVKKGFAGLQVDVADIYGLSIWHRFFCWLVGSNIELKEVRFAGQAPVGKARVAKYQQLFGCPVYYGQLRDEFVFDTRYLSYPLVHNERTLKDFLRAAPYPLMVMSGSRDDGSLVARVRAMIGHDFSQGFPSFERITAALNMSAPTLRRRLKKEGTTFQQLKDECRRDAAMAYLGNSELSINAVAALMGFTDPSAFHRCFKKWTAMTPGEYRVNERESHS
ncbi:AraC family transcriptional regulator [gamma proteobacterium BDW918]|uniref:AraC family transcriptional regulator n=1 Tax=Zhongshania aliphaticivorans TaxID=1470434 RepID=A0A127M6I6_9GAMM|nr:AraC family transcriptional regulator [Zhongshania aliphaticivorans]AMO68817.1 AraC family transcriptional regulator [Zhongshania aliphaticivorans]EIF43551.1 AraC family transcriptional regulator [gamma proteobacterium BDW918]